MKAKFYDKAGNLIRTLANVLNATEDKKVTVKNPGKPGVDCYFCPDETVADVRPDPSNPEDLGAEGYWVYREKKDKT